MKSRREAKIKAVQSKEELIIENERYVQRLVGSMAKRYRIPQDRIEEYISAGYLGLVEAAERYSPAYGEFRSYAYLRIRGAVIDAIRENCDLNRDMYRATKVASAINELAEADFVETGLGVQIPEGAAGEKLATLLNFIAKGAIVYKLSSEDAENELNSIADEQTSAEEQLIEDQEISDLERVIKRLPKEERKVIQDYYFKDRSFKEILEDSRYSANRSKSWISKLHSRALDNLRTKLELLKSKRGEEIGEEI